VDPEGSSIYTVRGAQPRPLPSEQEVRWSRRGSFILVAVMFGWMLLVYILSAAVGSRDPNVEVPLEVGLGVVVTPADGWYDASRAWDTGPSGISLQSSGVYVAFWAESFAGTNDDLLTEALASLESDYDALRVLPAAARMVAGGVPALISLFSATTDYGRVEGELAAVTSAGVGVLMWAEAQEGQLAKLQDDLDSMLDTMVIPR